jgi:hypothetical protein
VATLLHLHQTWIGLTQPHEGLMVSADVLADEAGMPEAHDHHRDAVLAWVQADPPRPLVDLLRALGVQDRALGTDPDLCARFLARTDREQDWVRPSAVVLGATRDAVVAPRPLDPDDPTPPVVGMVLWDVPPDLHPDTPEEITSTWRATPTAKLLRMLRADTPLGLMGNRRWLRLVYQPRNEGAAHLTFPLHMLTSRDARPLVDGLVCLLGDDALCTPPPMAHRCLEGLLEATRRRQLDVSGRLAEQALEAMGALLEGFEAAARLAPASPLARALDEAGRGGPFHEALLTVLLRLVFLLFAEDRELLPMDEPVYASAYSAHALWEELELDQARFPDSMDRRFGAWPRLLALFRMVHDGFGRGPHRAPPRHGELFDPAAFPFLENAVAPAADPTAIDAPRLDDGTVLRVLRALCRLDGQRLSYRTLAVEQIGAVYEGLMGWRVERLAHDAVFWPKAHLWLQPEDLLALEPGARRSWLRTRLGLPNAEAGQVAEALADRTPAQARDALRALGGPRARTLPAGRWVLQPGPTRRRTSAHYTPRELSERVVRHALATRLAPLGDAPSAAQLLALRVVDPAMGSGAFLVEACRQLADHVHAAWLREGRPDSADLVHTARRLVAQRCLYGVDINRQAVSLAKLSLWLFTLARDLPFTFVDHALVHGDALVGLTLPQLHRLHWDPAADLNLALWESRVRGWVDQALDRRRRLLALATENSTAAWDQRTALLREAHDLLRPLTATADQVVRAFLDHDRPRPRAAALSTLQQRVSDRLLADVDGPAGQRSLLDATGDSGSLWAGRSSAPGWDAAPALPPPPEGSERPPLHWPLAFPEVLGEVGGGFDVVIGNPPFAGKNMVSEQGGTAYIPWLQAVHEGAHGNGDLCAHFFRRAHTLAAPDGVLGLVATNTISQGDTRQTGLDALVAQGWVLTRAEKDLPWAGDAAVTVTVVHAARGTSALGVTPELDGRPLPLLGPALSAGVQLGVPAKRPENAGRSFQGMNVLGKGFTLTPDEAAALLAADARNAERIFPYLGGKEVNTHPRQEHGRYVIDFADLSLEQAAQWPMLLERVERLVKPERDQLNDNADGRRRKAKWWQFGRDTPALRRALAGKSRCLVNSQVSKHLMFSWQPAGRVFSQKLVVFPDLSDAEFAVMQSRVHEVWAWRFSSTMKTDLNYSPSDCFETFRFPPVSMLGDAGVLAELGRELDAARRAWMERHQQGLTALYNALQDPRQRSAEVVSLRRVHEAVDRAVCEAYGWPELAATVPPREHTLAGKAREAGEAAGGAGGGWISAEETERARGWLEGVLVGVWGG